MIQSVMAPLAPTLERTRLLVLVFGMLGGITLALTTIAVYGLTQFEIRRRRHELTIRLALGATPRALRQTLALMTVRPVAVGVLVGLPAGWLLTMLLRRSVPLVEPGNAYVYLTASAAILAAALIAAWTPGHRLGTLRAARILRSF